MSLCIMESHLFTFLPLVLTRVVFASLCHSSPLSLSTSPSHWIIAIDLSPLPSLKPWSQFQRCRSTPASRPHVQWCWCAAGCALLPRFSLSTVGGGAFTDGVAFGAPLAWELTRCGPNGTILFNNSRRCLDRSRGGRGFDASALYAEKIVPVAMIIGHKMQQNSHDSQHKTPQKPMGSVARNMLSIRPLQERENASINH
jgi:hypothetical protein